MGFLSSFILILSSLLIGFFFIVLLVQLLLLYIIYRMIKKYPILALFLLIILIGLGIAESLTVAGIIPGIIISTSSAITIISNYVRFKKAIKKLL